MIAPPVAGLILAGGRGSRLGAAVPKPLVELGGRPLLAHVLDRVPPSISPRLVNANERQAFAGFGLPIVADRFGGFQGPLAGLEAGSAFLRQHHPDIRHLLCLPGDTPFLPDDLAPRLLAGAGPLPCFASFAGRLHPTIGLWPLRMLDGLPAYLEGSTKRSLVGFAETLGFETVEFGPSSAAPGGDPFFNVNTPEDLAAAAHEFSR